MSENGVKTTTLPRVSTLDSVLGNRENSTVHQTVGDLGTQLAASGAVQGALNELRSQITSGLLSRATWTQLQALDGGSDGAGGEVPDSDTGSHLQATATGYNGATVPNAGRYSWNAAWSRWERIGSTGLSGKADTASLAPVATSGSYDDLSEKPTLGTAAGASTGDFATAAQGAKADTAVQPAAIGTAAAQPVGAFATAAQGAKADAALPASALVAGVGDAVDNATPKVAPVDADTFAGSDSAADGALRKFTWANLKAALRGSLGQLIDISTPKSLPVGADALLLSSSTDGDATRKIELDDLKGWMLEGVDDTYAKAPGVDRFVPIFGDEITHANFGAAYNYGGGDESAALTAGGGLNAQQRLDKDVVLADLGLAVDGTGVRLASSEHELTDLRIDLSRVLPSDLDNLLGSLVIRSDRNFVGGGQYL